MAEIKKETKQYELRTPVEVKQEVRQQPTSVKKTGEKGTGGLIGKKLGETGGSGVSGYHGVSGEHGKFGKQSFGGGGPSYGFHERKKSSYLWPLLGLGTVLLTLPVAIGAVCYAVVQADKKRRMRGEKPLIPEQYRVTEHKPWSQRAKEVVGMKKPEEEKTWTEKGKEFLGVPRREEEKTTGESLGEKVGLKTPEEQKSWTEKAKESLGITGQTGEKKESITGKTEEKK